MKSLFRRLQSLQSIVPSHLANVNLFDFVDFGCGRTVEFL